MTYLHLCTSHVFAARFERDYFFVKDFSEIEGDNELKLTYLDDVVRYKKMADGTLKPTKLDNYDYVCQEYRYQCIQEPNLTYYVFRIFRATDKDLKQFVGKAFVQKVEEDHQIITSLKKTIQYMYLRT